MLLDVEYDAGWGATYVASQADVSIVRAAERAIVCAKLGISTSDNRSTYALFGLLKNDGRPANPGNGNGNGNGGGP